jgi:hypothetical protein
MPDFVPSVAETRSTHDPPGGATGQRTAPRAISHATDAGKRQMCSTRVLRSRLCPMSIIAIDSLSSPSLSGTLEDRRQQVPPTCSVESFPIPHSPTDTISLATFRQMRFGDQHTHGTTRNGRRPSIRPNAISSYLLAALTRSTVRRRTKRTAFGCWRAGVVFDNGAHTGTNTLTHRRHEYSLVSQFAARSISP